MDRRAFLGTLAGGLLAAPLAAEAQKAAKVSRVGWFYVAPPAEPLRDAFYSGLREQGFVSGRDVVVEERPTGETPEQLLTTARELVALPVDVLVSGGGFASLAAKKATSSIPVVFYSVGDPIILGLVASLHHPGGNMTGIAIVAGSDITAKNVELLKEAVPKLSRVAVLYTEENLTVTLESIKHTATLLNISVDMVSFRRPDELEAAFTRMRKQRAQGLVIVGGSLTWATRQKIANLALAHRLPSSFSFAEAVEAGRLLSLGANFEDTHIQCAHLVAKILKGAKPAELPVEQPTKFKLVINLKTAKTLGLTIPPSLLARADQVIE